MATRETLLCGLAALNNGKISVTLSYFQISLKNVTQDMLIYKKTVHFVKVRIIFLVLADVFRVLEHLQKTAYFGTLYL